MAYGVVCFLLLWWRGLEFEWSFLANCSYDLQFAGLIMLLLYAFIPYRATLLWWKGQDAEFCGPVFRKEMREQYFTPEVALDFFLVLASLKIVLVLHTTIKQAIPLLNPLIYDQPLLQFDIAIHFGSNPNSTWSNLARNPAIGRFIDRSYYFWYYLKGVVLAVFVLTKNRVLLGRFFYALFSLWIFGGLLSVFYPSVGPIYFNPEWYVGINSPIAKALQQQLWGHYHALVESVTQPSLYLYEGVAAFPSLHVGVVALYALATWELNRFFSMSLFAYLAVMQYASVALGWHYAIDGYAGIVLAWLFFALARNIVIAPPNERPNFGRDA